MKYCLGFVAALMFLPALALASSVCTPESYMNDLRKSAFEINQKSKMDLIQCHRLKKGESANVEWDQILSPTNVDHAFRLTRTGEKSFKSEVRLNVIPRPEDNISDKDIEKFKTKIGKCLENSFKDIPGPNGEKLTITISEDPKVPISDIKLTNTNIREDSTLYSTKTNCVTIMHEILHLHGLVDEYHEETMGLKLDKTTGVVEYLDNANGAHLAFDCRHVGKNDSIMNNPFAAVVNSKEWVQWTYEVCAEKTTGVCPAGAKHSTEMVNLTPGEVFGGAEGMVPNSQKISKKIPNAKKSLLEPSQFMAITRPGCEKENKLYYACSANAYVTSIEGTTYGMPMGNMTGGTMGGMINTKAHSACQPTPSECNDPKAWSGEK